LIRLALIVEALFPPPSQSTPTPCRLVVFVPLSELCQVRDRRDSAQETRSLLPLHLSDVSYSRLFPLLKQTCTRQDSKKLRVQVPVRQCRVSIVDVTRGPFSPQTENRFQKQQRIRGPENREFPGERVRPIPKFCWA
jgi:hypothetical protein